MYCLKDPKGKLHYETIARFKSKVWAECGFDAVCNYYDKTEFRFAEMYWDRWESSWRAAVRGGWKFVKLRIVEEEA